MKKFVALLIGACALSATADEFVLSDGSVLQDATVVRTSLDSVLVRHSNGVQQLLFDRLSPQLQQQLGMTPELVAERRAAAQQAAEKRRLEREAAQAARLAALQASGQHPRYLSGADMYSIYSSVESISPRTAEYLAALWNRREAARMGLVIDVERYAADAAGLRGVAEAELANLRAAQQAQREVDKLRAQVAQLQQQNEALRKQLADARAGSPATSTTVVVDNPVYVPVPTPVGRPCPPPPPRRPVAAPRHPRPVIHSNNPRPASSAHTLPRR